jgi:hypothetical protein
MQGFQMKNPTSFNFLLATLRYTLPEPKTPKSRCLNRAIPLPPAKR